MLICQAQHTWKHYNDNLCLNTEGNNDKQDAAVAISNWDPGVQQEVSLREKKNSWCKLYKTEKQDYLEYELNQNMKHQNQIINNTTRK